MNERQPIHCNKRQICYYNRLIIITFKFSFFPDVAWSSLRGRFRKNEALLWRHTTLLISGYNSTYVQGRRMALTHVYESYCSILIIHGLIGWNMTKSITLRTPHFFWTCPKGPSIKFNVTSKRKFMTKSMSPGMCKKYEWAFWPPSPFSMNFLLLATLNFVDGP